MERFSSFSKSAFWSQFLLGLVAIFALPAVSSPANSVENPSIAQQVVTLSEYSVAKKMEREQTLFLQVLELSPFPSLSQAVEFCEFFTKPYRLLGFSLPPIRAGPVV